MPPTDRSLQPDPTFERLTSEAHLRMRQTRYADAEACIARLRALSPDHPTVLELHGDLATAQRKFRLAEQLYYRALLADPTSDKLEEKYATALVKSHEGEIMAGLAGSEIDDLLDGRQPRHAWFIVVIAALFPGVATWLRGQWRKGAIITGAWLIGWMAEATLMWRIHALKEAGRITSDQLASHVFSGASLFLLVALLGIWIYSLIDATMPRR